MSENWLGPESAVGKESPYNGGVTFLPDFESRIYRYDEQTGRYEPIDVISEEGVWFAKETDSDLEEAILGATPTFTAMDEVTFDPEDDRPALDKINETLRDREGNYGDGEEVFQAIADSWNAHLKPILEVPLEPSDVAVLMVLFKIARSKAKASRESLDDLLDMVGYSAFAHDLRQAGS